MLQADARKQNVYVETTISKPAVVHHSGNGSSRIVFQNRRVYVIMSI
jgi:hypothetical protein